MRRFFLTSDTAGKALFIFFFVFLPVSGFPVDSAEFKELRSQHFIFQYQPGVEEVFVNKLKEDAEHFYREITHELYLVRNKAWIWDNRAKIIIAEDKKSYLEKFGCQPWSLACVDYADKVIYTFPSQQGFTSTLKHELAHIIFREYIGYHKFPLWLDEGMAAYIQYKGTAYPEFILPKVKEAIKNGSYIKFSDIGKIYFLADDDLRVEMFYQQAFSMVYFLIEKFGRFNFKRVLGYLKKGYRLEYALKKTLFIIRDLESFEESWKRFYLR